MSVKALFFDLDGTISDTHAIHLANWLELLRPYSIDVDMDLYKEKLSGDRSTREIVDDVLPDLSEDEKKDLIEREESGYRSRMTQTGPITGLGDFIEEAKNRGISVTLVSNAPKGDAQNSLEGAGLKRSFRADDLRRGRGREEAGPGRLPRGAKGAWDLAGRSPGFRGLALRRRGRGWSRYPGDRTLLDSRP